MKRKIYTIVGVLIVSLGAYMLFVMSGDNNEPKESKVEDIKQLVKDYTDDKFPDQSASITSQQLIVTDKDKNQTTYALPDDVFFVSIAPYINKTHPCETHSLTGCQGELVGKEFNVYIEDNDGNVVLDKKMTSQSNGFIDLWLPRDKDYKVSISQDGKKAESEISTFKEDNTCVTTMQLS